MYLLQIDSHADWGSFFGHFHPVVVHLPIGILFIAFILEMLRLKTKNSQLNVAIPIILFWGFISAVISCVFGWLLSLSGDYNEDTLFWHQWLGISVAAIAGLLWILKKRNTNSTSLQFKKIYTSLVVGTMVLLLFTGHLGGSMTHGEDYLTANTPQPFKRWLGITTKEAKSERKPITDINEALIYKDVIEPVLETKCWTCHNATKKKGQLRMDTEELLLKGGKNGVVIKANDATGSEMIKRLLLPKDDDKRMPPKGKPGPTTEEIELIKWWISNGASFTAKVKAVKQSATVEPYFKKYLVAGSVESTTSSSEKKVAASAVFTQKITAADKAIIEPLKKENLLITPVAQNQPFIEISAINAPGFSDNGMKLINKLSLQLVWLKLSNTKITDAGIKEISNCKNLVRLYLEGTAVTNGSTAIIKQFQFLEYLNIIGTSIDDTGLLELSGIKNLKQIYCWQTAITAKGVDAFKKINPGVKIVFGDTN